MVEFCDCEFLRGPPSAKTDIHCGRQSDAVLSRFRPALDDAKIASHFNQASGGEDDVLNLELENILSSNCIDMREDLRNQIAIGR
jgi:hypothetical protein